VLVLCALGCIFSSFSRGGMMLFGSISSAPTNRTNNDEDHVVAVAVNGSSPEGVVAEKPQVIFTNVAHVETSATGTKLVNQYEVLEKLGSGSFGKGLLEKQKKKKEKEKKKMLLVHYVCDYVVIYLSDANRVFVSFLRVNCLSLV
jgi:hypothetical protein